MKKNLTTAVIVTAFHLLNEAKITKMEDSDKFTVIKALRVLKKIAVEFDEFKKDSEARLKPENYDDILKKAQQWQTEGENTTLSEEERKGINLFFAEYTAKVNECIREESEKEREVEYAMLNEEAFGKLVASNDWTLGQIDAVSEVVAE